MARTPPSSIVTLLTDFGVSDPYVAILKGAVLRQHKSALLVDVGHAVPAQDLEAAAFLVATLPGRFPLGTVHVVVVDPGVGTARRPIAVHAAGDYWVAPDNGVLEPVLAREDAEVVRIDVERIGLGEPSRTFHGRDVFAPVAGMLARGTYGFRALGPRIDDPVRRPRDTAPRVVWVDHFGNLVTNLVADPRRPLTALRVGDHRLPVVGTYGEAETGAAVALVGSFGRYEIAVVDGSAAARLGLGVDAAVAPEPGAEDDNP